MVECREGVAEVIPARRQRHFLIDARVGQITCLVARAVVPQTEIQAVVAVVFVESGFYAIAAVGNPEVLYRPVFGSCEAGGNRLVCPCKVVGFRQFIRCDIDGILRVGMAAGILAVFEEGVQCVLQLFKRIGQFIVGAFFRHQSGSVDGGLKFPGGLSLVIARVFVDDDIGQGGVGLTDELVQCGKINNAVREQFDRLNTELLLLCTFRKVGLESENDILCLVDGKVNAIEFPGASPVDFCKGKGLVLYFTGGEYRFGGEDVALVRHLVVGFKS